MAMTLVYFAYPYGCASGPEASGLCHVLAHLYILIQLLLLLYIYQYLNESDIAIAYWYVKLLLLLAARIYTLMAHPRFAPKR